MMEGMNGNNEKERDLLGEDRERLTGEERLKITVAMPLWLKVRIWKESKDKGIPIWKYLARLIKENEELKKGGAEQYIKKLDEEKRKLEAEYKLALKEIERLKIENEHLEADLRSLATSDLMNYKSLSERRKEIIELLKKIIIDIKENCGECAENVLGKYKKERNEAVSFFINKLLGLEGGYRDV
jgi:hypothetical protein